MSCPYRTFVLVFIYGIHDRGGSLPSLMTVITEYIRREVMQMTAYEIIMIIIGMIGLPISVCSLLLALLTFLDKRNKRK